MSSTQLRRPKIFLTLAVSAATLFHCAEFLRAGEPEVVELTIMFNTDRVQFELLPMPYGEDAIGIVLDGTKPSDSTAVSVDSSFGDFAGGVYYLTEGRYLAKGGPTFVSVLVTNPLLLPPHGFISLKKCEIIEHASGFAGINSGEYFRDEEGGFGLVFIRGLFEVQ